MTLIKDLIEIPERVYKDQYVLRLSEGVTRPEETLRDYVVTHELTTCFDAALSIIRSAVTNRTIKAAFLHGSFGRGKSHYMAGPICRYYPGARPVGSKARRFDRVLAKRASMASIPMDDSGNHPVAPPGLVIASFRRVSGSWG